MKNSIFFNKEIFRYLIVGIGSVSIDFITYYLLINYSNQFTPSTAKRVSFIAGGIWSFIVNKLYTFRSKELKLQEPILFVFIYLVGFVLNTVVHDRLIVFFKINTIAFLFATTISIVWNYFGQKFLVFRTNNKI